MKKCAVLLLFGLASFVLMPSPHCIAKDSKFSAGGGFAYGTGLSNFGLELRGYYELDIKEALILIVPDLVYYFGEDTGFESCVNWLTFDVMGHWIFEQSEGWYLYALAGPGFTVVTTTVGDHSRGNTNINFNVGAGLEREMDFGGLFGEFRFVASSSNQLVFSVGGRFQL